MIVSNKVTVDVTVKEVLSKIELSVSDSTINTGDTDTFTATAYDQNNNTMAGIAISLMENGTEVDSGTTDSSGSVQFSAKFNKAGDFTFTAQAS